MMSLRSLLLAALLLASSTSAFVVPASSRTNIIAASTTRVQSSEMGEDPQLEELGPLAVKMAGVLAVKTAKDIVNYPPQLFDQLTRQATGKDEMNPVVMLAKLMGVLIFKFVHDATYYPMVWSQRMIECQSLDECKVDEEGSWE